MKLQLASDLHLELLKGNAPGSSLISPHPDADVLVLAGDIGLGTVAVDLFADWGVPVVYVMGNHESYGRDIELLEDELRVKAQGTQVHFLECDRFDYEGVRFLGTSLWTDFELGASAGHAVEAAMNAARVHLRDHSEIRLNRQPFGPIDALLRHERSRAWLTKVLADPFDGPTVVVTHHGVDARSIDQRYAEHPVNASFASNLGPLLERADLWLHGHVHNSVDYRVGGARIVANPRGYVLSSDQGGDDVGSVAFENFEFDPLLVIDVVTRL